MASFYMILAKNLLAKRIFSTMSAAIMLEPVNDLAIDEIFD
jgi:hypothetical protein